MENKRFSALQMIDVGAKKSTQRTAIAMGKIFVGADAFQLIREKKLPKGDALLVAEIAGIQAAKNTSQLLPLCRDSLIQVAKAVRAELAGDLPTARTAWQVILDTPSSQLLEYERLLPMASVLVAAQ